MKLKVNQLLWLAYKGVAEAAPDGLKKNGTLRQLGQLMQNVQSYGEYTVDVPKPQLSEKGAKALEELEGPGWVRKGCNCK